ncbi:MAG: polysaccharide biosynthesis/export family protein [Gammaproteobacteria bacterium]|tara:strand:- start:1821 stop:2621 length:801 start_codon:yes stop_codon:yes gene_type:complete
MKKKVNLIIIALAFISGCSLSPGMHMDTKSSWQDKSKYVFIDSIQKDIRIINISETQDVSYKNNYLYKIGVGDQIAVTIWGLPEIFPINVVNADQNLRRVDANGNIFFPYVGLIEAAGKTQDELRNDLTTGLSEYFNDPQIDVTVARFNSQQVFVLGEVTRPKKLNITDIPISLSNAIGESSGLNTNTAAGSEVFIIRQSGTGGDPLIFHANLKNPSSFIEAGNFYLKNNDIVYVNASGTARWNKVISQFFPFSTFLNSIDNLTTD